MLAYIFANFLLFGMVVKKVSDMKVIGVVLDSRLLFESYIRLIADSASSKLVIMRKVFCLFRYPVLVFAVSLELLASSVRVLLSCLDACSSFSSLSS